MVPAEDSMALLREVYELFLESNRTLMRNYLMEIAHAFLWRIAN